MVLSLALRGSALLSGKKFSKLLVPDVIEGAVDEGTLGGVVSSEEVVDVD